MLRSFVYALVTTLAMMGLTQAQAGEVIYSNGDILTMDGDEPIYAEAVVTQQQQVPVPKQQR